MEQQPEVAEAKVSQDPWDVEVNESDEKSWAERSMAERILFVAIQFGKVVCVLSFLYLFIISLGLMGSAFKILGGPSAGSAFRNQEIFDNPVAGLVLGVLATVLVQSSSTSTSIIITMTAAGLMEIKNAVPMIMGANIGTSVTNTIVSIGQMGDKNEYRRAFAGATVHDCFNLLTVAVLLPIEAATGMLQHMAGGLVDAFGITDDQEKGSKVDFLKVITKPVTSRLVQVDKKLVTAVAKEKDDTKLQALLKQSMIVNSQSKSNHLFMDTSMSDGVAGTILLIVSLLLLTSCLVLLVKTLQTVFRGRAAIWMKSLLNLEFKRVPCIADYILIAFGAGITILMQSSSITTSTLTPLVGIGLIKLEKMFPFTVGANIGTTVTGILSALAASNIATGMTVAMAHLLFNIIGTIVWFPIPMMRRVPLSMAKFNGNMAADSKWYPVAYTFFVFFFVPGLLFMVSLGGPAVAGVFISFILLTLLSLILLVALRLLRPNALPGCLKRDPAWLPRTMMVSPPEELDSSADAVVTSSADLNKDAWWQGNAAWAAGWFVVILLVVAVPNSQWANLHYTKFDSREHVGIGAWATCSKAFTKEANYMAPIQRCNSLQIADCFAGLDSSCAEEDFSSANGANAMYEKSWSACKANCTTEEWFAECNRIPCSGSSHAKQCYNVSAAVLQPFHVTYRQGRAWAAGSMCRPNQDILSNASALANAGNLGITGLVAGFVAQTLLLLYVFFDGKRDMKVFLQASLAGFLSCWIFLLASWWVFADALEQEATAIIIHDSKKGAVVAGGKFKDIVANEGSISFIFVIGAWVCASISIALISHRLYTTSVRAPDPAPKAIEAAVQAPSPNQDGVDV
jgi:sodium-dependent phosphate cotransporter